MFEELHTALTAVAERVGPTLVTIGRDGRGTGLVVAPGRVVTNAHNLRNGTVQVAFADGRVEQGRVTATDPDGDLVVVTVDTGTTPAAEWGEVPGAGRVVFGASRGGFRTRVTAGVVSAADVSFRGPRGRKVLGSLEHTAPLPRGSSGGPVTDEQGRVVGINTHRIGDGFYVARPADDALRARVAELVAGTSTPTVSLGIAVLPPEVARRLRRSVGLDERDGLLVRGVEPGSPADRAGVRKGDLIVAVDGRPITSVDDLHGALQTLSGPDASLTLRVVRGVEDSDVLVRFAPDPTTEAETPAS